MRKAPDNRFYCKTCGYCDEITVINGICRISRPDKDGWPEVRLDTDWCGEHEEAEYEDDDDK